MVDAHRRFTYCDYGLPGVMGDSSIFEISELRRQIRNGTWLGASIPSLQLEEVQIQPYLIGDCAFTLSKHVMKTTSTREQKAHPELKEWEKLASKTRKPVECAFGILKKRFPVLKRGLSLRYEKEASIIVRSCTILHNLCIDEGESETDFELSSPPQSQDCEFEQGIDAKRIRLALLKYVNQQ